MSDDIILLVAMATFLLLSIGLGLTIWEFRNVVDASSTSEDENQNGRKGGQDR